MCEICFVVGLKPIESEYSYFVLKWSSVCITTALSVTPLPLGIPTMWSNFHYYYLWAIELFNDFVSTFTERTKIIICLFDGRCGLLLSHCRNRAHVPMLNVWICKWMVQSTTPLKTFTVYGNCIDWLAGFGHLITVHHFKWSTLRHSVVRAQKKKKKKSKKQT